MVNLLQLAEKVSSPFGYREQPTAGASTNHKGIDLVLFDDNVPAVQTGRISNAGYNSSRGYYVEVEQVDGTTATYMHLAKPSIYKKGDSILAGTTIGVQGSTGISTGKHLHYEVKTADGSYIDPAKYMSRGTTEHANFDTVSNDSGVSGIMGSIANFVAMLLLCVFAVVLFLKAFDISII